MKQFGFTLIELLVVISIAAVLSSVGIAAFFSYSKTEALNAAVSDFTTMLQVAKSRAQSQVKPADCSSLDGYKVDLISAGVYQLVAVCGGEDHVIDGQRKSLPKNTVFSCVDIAYPYFLFSVLTGAASGSQFVHITANNNTSNIKRIVVGETGVTQTDIGNQDCTALQPTATPSE